MAGPPDLIGRASELERLRRHLDVAQNGATRLVVMFGRRRAGKTYLRRHFAEKASERASVVFLSATRGSAQGQRDLLANELVRSGIAIRAGADRAWVSLLADVADFARHVPTVLIIDEAPYLIESDASWATVVQSMWDREQSRAEQSRLLLILNGSAIGTMTSVIASQGALYGRPSEVIRIDPFDLPTSHAMLGRPDAVRSIEAYAATGGYPLLLREWDPGAPAIDNLTRLGGSPFGPLVANAETLLRDVPDAGGHRLVLSTVGRGATKLSEISSRAGFKTQYAVEVLRRSGFIDRRTPLGERRPRHVQFRLVDTYLQFWFSVIEHRLQLIESGQGSAALARSLPQWTAFLGDVFEREARAHATRLAVQGILGDVLVGEWWSDTGNQAQIDVVGEARGRWAVVGEAKWSAEFGHAALAQLERSLELADRVGDEPRLASWSQLGPSSQVRLLRPAMLHFTAADMVEP